MEHLILILLCRLPGKTARRDPVSGDWVLRYGRFWLTFPLMVTAFFLTLAARPDLVGPPRNPGHVKYLVGGCLAFAFLGGLGLIEMIFIEVRLGDRSVTKHSPWRLPKTIAWEEIKEVSYSISGPSFKILGTDGTKISVSLRLSGLGTLKSELCLRLAPSLYEKTLPGFASIGLGGFSEADFLNVLLRHSQIGEKTGDAGGD